MKILIFNYEYPPLGGGGGVICKDISEEFVKMGHKVTVITSLFKQLQPVEYINGVEVIRVTVLNRDVLDVASLSSLLSYLLMSIKAANNLFKRNSYDIINTHFAVPSGPAGEYIALKFNIPNILSIHGGDINDPSKRFSPHNIPILKQAVKTILNRASRVVAQSTDTKNNAIDFYNIKRFIDIIPLGIKPNQCREVKRSDLGLPDDKLIFCTVGRLIRRKNLAELLKIFSSVKNNIPSKLIIIGDGPEYSSLKKKIKQLHLEDDVQLSGRLCDKDKFQILFASDIYLSTAMHEGFGIVFLEAMECGLPIISYDNGGHTDFLKDGVTGFLIKLGDKKNFRERLLQLINDKVLRDKISLENKSYVKNFYINNTANQYMELFKQVLSANRS